MHFQNHEEYLNKNWFCHTFIHFIFLVTLLNNSKIGTTIFLILPEKMENSKDLSNLPKVTQPLSEGSGTSPFGTKAPCLRAR